MHDDESMDRLLRNAMAAEVPTLSAGFDARVMRRVRPRRLPPLGRVVMTLYVAVAIALAAVSMRGLPPEWIVAGLLVAASVAAGGSAYVRRVTVRS